MITAQWVPNNNQMLTRSQEKASGAAEEDERSAIFMETGGKQCFQSINKTLRLLASPRSLVVIHRTSFVCETLDRTGRRHVFPFSTHSYRPVEVNKEIELHGCVFQTVIFNCVWRSELFIMCPPQSCREGSSPASCANVLKCLNTSTLFLWIIKGFCRKRHQNYVSF